MADRENDEKNTSDLIRGLIKTNDLKEFLDENELEMELPSFHVYISDFCKGEGKVPEQVIKKAGIERTYGHQLFNGTRNPSRDKVIQLAFGLELNLEETQKLLKIAHHSPLYPKFKRDAVLLHCLVNGEDFWETQSILLSMQITLLGE
jgi:hypothetical protein